MKTCWIEASSTFYISLGKFIFQGVLIAVTGEGKILLGLLSLSTHKCVRIVANLDIETVKCHIECIFLKA